MIHYSGGLLECLCLSDPLLDQGLARYASKYVVAWRYSRFCFGSLVVAILDERRPFRLALIQKKVLLVVLVRGLFRARLLCPSLCTDTGPRYVALKQKA